MNVGYWGVIQWGLLIVSLGIVNTVVSARKNRFVLLFSLLFLCYLASQRTSIGDTIGYVEIYYLRAPTSISVFFEQFSNEFSRIGFWGINSILHSIFGDNIKAYFFAMAALITIPLLMKMNYYADDGSFVVVLFIMSGMFISTMNGMRQYLVTALFACCLPWIERGKIKKTILLILFLSTIHRSALILIPFLLLPRRDPWGKGTKTLLVGGVAAFLLYPILSPLVAVLLESSSEYGQYSQALISEEAGANIVRAIVLLVPVVLSYLERNELEYNYEYFGLILNGAILNFIFMLIASVQSWIVARFCIYFDFFSVILLGLCLKEMYVNGRIVKSACYICYFIYFIYDLSVMGLLR